MDLPSTKRKPRTPPNVLHKMPRRAGVDDDILDFEVDAAASVSAAHAAAAARRHSGDRGAAVSPLPVLTSAMSANAASSAGGSSAGIGASSSSISSTGNSGGDRSARSSVFRSAARSSLCHRATSPAESFAMMPASTASAASSSLLGLGATGVGATNLFAPGVNTRPLTTPRGSFGAPFSFRDADTSPAAGSPGHSDESCTSPSFSVLPPVTSPVSSTGGSPPATGAAFGKPSSGRRRGPRPLSIDVSSTSETVSPAPYDIAKPVSPSGDVPTMITDMLYLSSYAAAQDRRALTALGITHVLNCAGKHCQELYKDQFDYRTLNISDAGKDNVTDYAYTIIDFIESARKVHGKVLVHCLKGVSRSAAAIMSYLMWLNTWDYDRALAFMKTRRPTISPNPQFGLQLLEWGRSRVQQKQLGKPIVYGVSMHSTAVGHVPITHGPLEEVTLGMFTGTHVSDTDVCMDGARLYQASMCFALCGPRSVFLWHPPTISVEGLRIVRDGVRMICESEGFRSVPQVVCGGAETIAFWQALMEAGSGIVKLDQALVDAAVSSAARSHAHHPEALHKWMADADMKPSLTASGSTIEDGVSISSSGPEDVLRSSTSDEDMDLFH